MGQRPRLLPHSRSRPTLCVALKSLGLHVGRKPTQHPDTWCWRGHRQVGAQMCPETLLGGNRLHPFSARHPLPLPEVESADSGCSPRRNLIFYFMLNFLGSRTRCSGGRCAGEGLAYLNLRRNLNVILLKKNISIGSSVSFSRLGFPL